MVQLVQPLLAMIHSLPDILLHHGDGNAQLIRNVTLRESVKVEQDEHGTALRGQLSQRGFQDAHALLAIEHALCLGRRANQLVVFDGHAQSGVPSLSGSGLVASQVERGGEQKRLGLPDLPQVG